MDEPRVVVFDGICNLCNFWVDWLIRHDRTARLKFTSLQGGWAREHVPPDDLAKLQTILFYDGQSWHRRSTAVLRIAIELGGVLGFFARILLLVPSILRDAVYNLIARTRYRLFGQRAECRMPTESEKARFL